MTVGYLTGRVPAGGLLALLAVWLIAASWAYLDQLFRRPRRRINRRSRVVNKDAESDPPHRTDVE